MTEEIDLNTFVDLWVDNSYYILLGYDRTTMCYVHLYDRSTGKPIAHLLQNGRGADELVSLTSSWYDSGVLYLYSAMGNRTCFLDLKRWEQEGRFFLEEISPEIDDYGEIMLGNKYYGMALWNRSFLDNPVKSHERIRFLSREGGEILCYDEYPLADRRKTWMMYGQPCVSVSPDFRKMVLAPASHSGCLLELFDLMPEISLRKKLLFIEPAFQTDGNHFEPDDSLVEGIVSCSANNQGFVLAFDGETKVKEVFQDQASPCFDKLIWFDWDGNPIKQINVDFSLSCIRLCDNMVYAIGENAESERYIIQVNCDKL